MDRYSCPCCPRPRARELAHATRILLVLLLGGSAQAASLSELIAHAKPGAQVHVPAGTYSAPIVIDKPLQLIADGKVILEGAGDSDVLIIKAPDVTISGFIIRGTGIDLDKENAGVVILARRTTIENNTIEDVLFGISLKDADGSRIAGNRISGKANLDIARRGDAIKLWNSSNSIVENNTITGCRDLVMWYSEKLVVRGNHVIKCRYGIHFMYAGNATVADNELRDNSVGIFLMYGKSLNLHGNIIAHNRGPSGFGLGLKDVDGVDAHDNAFLDNRVGLHVDNAPSRYDITHAYRRNLFAYNDVALGFMPSVHDNLFVENSFMDNIEQVAVLGGGNLKNNSFSLNGKGNHWSDYRGYDANGDGIGDLPHRSQSVFENLMDRQPKLRLFLFSPAQQAIELASRAFPIVKPQIRATDDAPLMRPIAPQLQVGSAISDRWSWQALGAAAVLLGMGIVVVRTGRSEFGR